ncbi:MAG: tryptophan synthase subunit alpha [Deltaproteobacteria bacterium CG_4_10_14_3_um_filter_60_8]|nr:MAG: tryptophan synthase subunit alpha [Desulfobacterales bacterium CG2_30_60_27]PIP44366.1 MAG: tryptophan synthase subunit alpha [Deltaproteobacteria bacterium CG23_combo_of_CG06-09_8_20_14_all_60_8]PIY20879.1 MAG: tryptophan synthase subunit alpha [Deltaproteobacteria bacterium CG_4_10_14_3_um_filter_60_8]
MPLGNNLRQAMVQKNILLMTHIVLGYPSFAVNRQVIAAMVKNGVDLIEMQIPFSEPMADGPVIVKANQDALAAGATVADCLDFAAEMTKKHAIPFLFMTYYNIIFKYGEDAFFKKAKELGIQGFIVPDLPPEEGENFYRLAKEYDIAAILIYAPTTTETRMAKLAATGTGFIYCVARLGVTGQATKFDQPVEDYLARCRKATNLPLAVGFGISSKGDVDYLRGKADIAVVGTATIKLVDSEGVQAVGPFIAGLRG